MTDVPAMEQHEPPTPDDSPLRMRDVMASPLYHDLMTAKVEVGDLAFDFELPQLETGELTRLSTFAGQRPVALAFGSYT
jgi:hypothetical protein